MKQLKYIIAIIILCSLGCQSTKNKTEINKEMKQTLFYEIVPRDVDEISIANPHTKEIIYTIKGKNIFTELDSIVKFKKDANIKKHGCLGSADIYFKRDGKIVGAWNFAHGAFFGEYLTTSDVEIRLADWFANKGVVEFKKWLGKNGGFPPPRTGILPELNYLKLHQNADGSWGDRESRIFITSFVLLVFLNHGETFSSTNYGEQILKGVKWLIRQEPKKELDQVSMYHALTGIYFMTELPMLKQKVLKLRTRFNPKKLRQPSYTLFAITKQLVSTTKEGPIESNPIEVLFKKPEGPQSLLFYLKSLDIFSKGKEEWETYVKEVLVPLLENPQTDGALKLNGVSSKVESTAFIALSKVIYYRYWNYLIIDKTAWNNKEK